MAKGLEYKDAYNWVRKQLVLANMEGKLDDIRPVDLHSKLLEIFPKDQVPTTAHTVAQWKRDYDYNPAENLVETFKLSHAPSFISQNNRHYNLVLAYNKDKNVFTSIEKKLDEIILLLKEMNE
jgi:uncharacterized protein (UPF0297 family)